jgi:anaerobic selenocysteine-containing dehydrogenase
MGHHAGISFEGWVNITGMVGQHKTEWWVNMLRNLHLMTGEPRWGRKNNHLINPRLHRGLFKLKPFGLFNSSKIGEESTEGFKFFFIVVVFTNNEEG